MNNTKITWIALFAALVAVAGVAAMEWQNHTRHKNGFVMLKKVFDEFEMSKQYKHKLQSVNMARKSIIDSLELNLNAESRAIRTEGAKSKEKINQFEFDKQYFLEKRKQFDEDNGALAKQYDEEVIKQMNQYVKDYGEKEGYDLVFGAEGSGVLMYANDRLDITDNIIKYINERYKGASK